jgi:hypothetical protein
MPIHKFRVGQEVLFSPNAQDFQRLRGSYTIVRLLPSETRDQQYRVKSVRDGHERVVLESQLQVAATRVFAFGEQPPLRRQ